jgi:hypothetical protein
MRLNSVFVHLESNILIGDPPDLSELVFARRDNPEYFGILRNTPEYSGIFRNTPEYAGILRNIPEYSGILRNPCPFPCLAAPSLALSSLPLLCRMFVTLESLVLNCLACLSLTHIPFAFLVV